MATESVENYLKTIYHLASSGERVAISGVADRLGISSASVSSMIKRLSSQGFVEHRPFGEVRLTAEGSAVALRVVRRHRLIETFLHDVLGMPWDELHDEAEVLEHAISDRLERRIAEVLGEPTHDPHGDPIPPRRGKHVERAVDHRSLSEVAVGASVRVERVSDRKAAALRYLGNLGLKPGVVLTVQERDPFGGPLWVTIDGDGRQALGSELVDLIRVSILDESSGQPRRDLPK